MDLQEAIELVCLGELAILVETKEEKQLIMDSCDRPNGIRASTYSTYKYAVRDALSSGQKITFSQDPSSRKVVKAKDLVESEDRFVDPDINAVLSSLI